MDSLNKKEFDSLPEMVFIIGMGRSGTTLLTNILNSHDEIIATPENEFIINFHNHFKRKEFKDKKVVEEFVSFLNFKYSKTISFWKPKEGLINSILELEDSQKTYANICKLVYLHYPFAEEKTNVKLIIDKNPIYTIYIKNLKRIYPKSKFIILVRDYRDNILSRKKYSDTKSSIYKLAASWNYFYKVIENDCSEIKNDIHYLKYENLVSEPEKELKLLCSFLGVNYQNKLLEYQDLSIKIKTHLKENVSGKDFKKITTMHSNLEEEINTKRVSAFKNEMDQKQLILLDKLCNKNALKYGYEPISKNKTKLSFFETMNYLFAYYYVWVFYISRPVVNKLPLKIKLKKD